MTSGFPTRLRLSGVYLVFAVHLAALCGYAATDAKGACDGPFSLGLEIVDLREGRQAAVWYPSSGEPKKYKYTRRGRISTQLAKGGEPNGCGPFPLVLFSHGLAGCGTQTLFFTEELAKRGYVVAAPDHADAGCSVNGTGSLNPKPPQGPLFEPDKWTDATYVDRRDDIRLLLNQLIESEQFGSLIDVDKVGAVGHSVGGYTVLGMAGAWSSWHDERIKAVLAFSPYSLPFTAKSTLAGVGVPVMYQGAVFDIGITPFIEGPNGAFAATGSPRYFVKLRGGTHFEWTNLLCAGDPTVERCLETSANARLINAYGFAFLDRYLKGQESTLLVSDGEGLNQYERITLLTTVSAANFDPQIGVAPESIATGFSEGLAQVAGAAEDLPLPTEIHSLAFAILDAAKAVHSVPLLYVSSNQANLVIPSSAALGSAMIQGYLQGRLVAEGPIQINAAAPGLFSADGQGHGLAAATFTRVTSTGESTTALTFDPSNLNPVPIELGIPGEDIYVSLFGTGMRGLQAPLTARVGGTPVALVGPVPQGEFVALDQVNLGPLPLSLDGRGEVDIELSADSFVTNTVTIVTR